MQRTALFDEYAAHNAKVVDFHGWELPIQFAGIVQEHHHTRTRVSVFDCSHMGEIRMRGKEAIAAYDSLVTSDVAAIPTGRGRYGMMLNEQGGIIDDLITIRLADDELLVVCNAGPVEQVASTIAKAAQEGTENISDTLAKIDVQGPLARDVMREAGFDQAESLKYFQACRMEWQQTPVVVTRMGYTGELGYEIYVPNEQAPALWRTLLAMDEVKPAGLGARDTLRLEMGYLLSGQDMDEQHTPLEAGLEMFVAWQSDFVGKAALEEQKKSGAFPVLTGIMSVDRRSPRSGQEVRNEAGTPVGVVTSGTFGPSVERGIGLAYITGAEHRVPGAPLQVGPRGMRVEVTQPPFYKHGTCRK